MHESTTSEILPIQRVVACSSPSAWQDGVVTAVHDGVVEITALSGVEIRLRTAVAPAPGEPVAFHPVAEVLAVGDSWVRAA